MDHFWDVQHFIAAVEGAAAWGRWSVVQCAAVVQFAAEWPAVGAGEGSMRAPLAAGCFKLRATMWLLPQGTCGSWRSCRPGCRAPQRWALTKPM